MIPPASSPIRYPGSLLCAHVLSVPACMKGRKRERVIIGIGKKDSLSTLLHLPSHMSLKRHPKWRILSALYESQGQPSSGIHGPYSQPHKQSRAHLSIY